jgi:alpha-galactosidase
MPKLKITLVGGGSLNWTPRVVSSILAREYLDGSEVCLFDLNSEMLALTHKLSTRFKELAGSSSVVTQTTDRATAFEGADVVVVTITTGGLRAMRSDIETAERYGIYHTVGDTCGPAGISRSLRNVPVFLELGQAMEEHCPDAWMLNCSNPLSPLTRVVDRETSIKAIGICHGVPGAARQFRTFAEADQIAYVNAGIDHLAWFTSFKADGRDMTELLRDRGVERWLDLSPDEAQEDETFGSLYSLRNGIRLGLQIGALPAIGDRHLCEFLPMFLSSEDNVARFGLTRTSVSEREERAAEGRDRIQKTIDDPDLVLPETTSDDIGAWTCALFGGEPTEDNVSAPNLGQIPQLPEGCVVETRGLFDAAGCHPITSPMPEAIEAIVRPHAIRDEMVIDAALDGDFDKALAAISSDPLVGSEDAKPLLTDLIAGTKEWLPRF